MSVQITATKRVLQSLVRGMEKAQGMNDLVSFKRCSAVYRYLSGEGPAGISASINVSAEIVRKWVHKFAVEGINGFVSKPRRGKTSRLDKHQKAALYGMIEQGPLSHGFMGNAWNSAMIAILIERKFRVSYSIKYIPQLLKAIGMSFQKAKFEAAQRCPVARHRWLTVTWPSILRKAKRRQGKILFGDEASFAIWGSLSYTWAPCGKQPIVKTKGMRKSVKVSGLIEFGSGKVYYQAIDDKLNSQSYIEFLRSVLTATRKHLFLVQDGAGSHHSADVVEFMSRRSDRVSPFKLPVYSPDDNPIEKLWKNVKAKGTHLVYFDSFDELMDRVAGTMQWFASNPKEVRSLFGTYETA